MVLRVWYVFLIEVKEENREKIVKNLMLIKIGYLNKVMVIYDFFCIWWFW